MATDGDNITTHREKSSPQSTSVMSAPSQEMLSKVQTADSVWIPRDVFEKLYLNPERAVAGDLRKKVAKSGQYLSHC
jgi:hypothetical protein